MGELEKVVGIGLVSLKYLHYVHLCKRLWLFYLSCIEREHLSIVWCLPIESPATDLH